MFDSPEDRFVLATNYKHQRPGLYVLRDPWVVWEFFWADIAAGRGVHVMDRKTGLRAYWHPADGLYPPQESTT